MKQGIEHTSNLAQWYSIAPIQDEESESEFRHRVSGQLRDRGHIIEAHEAHSNMRYDDPSQSELGPMAGIMGACAMALQGKDYGSSGSSQVCDETAAGVYVEEHNRNGTARDAVAALFFLMMGKR